MNSVPTTASLLTAARNRIAKGWTQGEYYDEFMNVSCAVGGLNYETNVLAGEIGKKDSQGFPIEAGYISNLKKFRRDHARLYKARARALTYLSRAISQLGFRKPTRRVGEMTLSAYVIDFNDDDGRTKAEVLAAFDRAISNAKRRHLNG